MMLYPWFGYGVIFLFGLIFGSFLTFAFYRIKTGEPWLWGKGAIRSKCPSCNSILKIRDLIPVLSWIMSRGRCRYCNKAISIRYPLIEIITALICLIIWIGYQALA
jgi:prepilin signal peptidase PulO-like enzyme (type II secretory pathway)